MKKTSKQNACFCPRDSIYYQDKVPSSPIINAKKVVCSMRGFRQSAQAMKITLTFCIENENCCNIMHKQLKLDRQTVIIVTQTLPMKLYKNNAVQIIS